MLSQLYSVSLWILAFSAVLCFVFLILTMIRIMRLGSSVRRLNASSDSLENSLSVLDTKQKACSEAVQKPIRKIRTCAKMLSIAMAVRTGVHMMQHIAEKTFEKARRS